MENSFRELYEDPEELRFIIDFDGTEVRAFTRYASYVM